MAPVAEMQNIYGPKKHGLQLSKADLVTDVQMSNLSTAEPMLSSQYGTITQGDQLATW